MNRATTTGQLCLEVWRGLKDADRSYASEEYGSGEALNI